MAERLRWSCETCGASTDSEPGHEPAPRCGQTTEHMNRFADGGWVMTMIHVTHGEMVRGEVFDDNPLAGEVDGSGFVQECAACRAEVSLPAGASGIVAGSCDPHRFVFEGGV